MSYWRFAAMIATSTVVMFVLMYLNTYLLSHVFYSETRVYMAILMGATMAIIMLGFMLSMYSNKTINISIFVGAAIVFAASLWLVRSQVTVNGVSYMKAMIPHHSIAIMTSSRANIDDSRVRTLADEIIFAQDKEIAEMRYLITDIQDNGLVTDTPGEASREVVSLDAALSSAKIEGLDPEFLTEQEITAGFANGQAECRYRYTPESPPVFVTGQTDTGRSGLIKISGDLVAVPAGNSEALTFESPGIRIGLSHPDGATLPENPQRRVMADLVMELDAGKRAGYEGYWHCAA